MAKARISLKLSSMIGTAKPAFLKTVLPNNKQAKEVFIAEHFSQIQTVSGVKLTDIRSNTDDSEGQADVLATMDGNEIGIQLTELKIAHRDASEDRSRKMTETLLNTVLSNIKSDHRIMVNIRSPLDYTNQSVKIVGKRLEALGRIIIEGIRNSHFSPSPVDYFKKNKSNLIPNPLDIPEKLKDVINLIEIFKIPDEHNTMCLGRENIFINFNFDIVVSSDEFDEQLVLRILAKKANSVTDTLII